jgi:hypothetical protein
MPNKQDVGVGRVGNPDLGGERRRQRGMGAKSRQSVIELLAGAASVGGRGVDGHPVDHKLTLCSGGGPKGRALG